MTTGFRVIPAVDLRDGHCVQLVGGAYDAERVRLPDPVAQALKWERMGAPVLHVVDLDAATGRGDNSILVKAILDALTIPVQVGGGVRSAEAVATLLNAGAARVVVGTKAVTDRAWLAEVADAHPYRVVVAVDARGDEILVKGWSEGSGVSLIDYARDIDPFPVAGILYTDVAREGQLGGPNNDGVARLAASVTRPVIASGGIADVADFDSLYQAGAWGAVVGMAAYTGRIDMEKALKRTWE